jgi:hypothetical protein
MELIKTAVYLKNRSLIKLLLDTTSWKSFHKEKSDFFNFRIIESLVYYHNVETETDPNRRTKLDFRARQIRLIRYSKESNQYKVWNSTNDKIEEITFTRINESNYIIILEELKEQKILLFLFNDPSSSSEIVKISIPSINFYRNKYKLLSIFIYYCPDVLALIKVNELDINKKFINLKQRLPWIF